MKASRIAWAAGAAICARAALAVTATGGDVAYVDENLYAVHTFTNGGSFIVTEGGLVDVLIVGGGGGGGASQQGGGGGGGGGFAYRQGIALTPGSYSVVVGAGGAGGYTNGVSTTYFHAQNGGMSSAFGIEVPGGGAGGCDTVIRSKEVKATDPIVTGGWAGGTGGGGASRYIQRVKECITGGVAVVGFGYDGGCSTNGATMYGTFGQGSIHCWAGGGGGAGGAGGNGVITQETGGSADTKGVAGAGGIGRYCSISGAEVCYGGGGGGGQACYQYASKPGTAGVGGIGGGGAGSGNYSNSSVYPGLNGTDGLGGGGGGGGGFGALVAPGGRGGDGVVIIRYAVSYKDTFKSAEGGDSVKRVNGNRVFTFVRDGTFKVTGNSTVEVLLVGGGGGGGCSQTGGGGGGGGGVIHKTLNLLEGEYKVVVGEGGAGGCTNGQQTTASGGWVFDSFIIAENGGDSEAFGLTAFGGGAGGCGTDAAKRGGEREKGKTGGSGGGGTVGYGFSNKALMTEGGLGVDGQGFSGGCATNSAASKRQSHVYNWAGGGGGAGEPGDDAMSVQDGDAITGTAGNGGDGLFCSITGVEVCYGGGGGGGRGCYNYLYSPGSASQGGQGGGGAGSGNQSNKVAYPGLDGTDGLGGGGGGGGGFGALAGKGGNGGDGVVIIRCKVAPKGLAIILR